MDQVKEAFYKIKEEITSIKQAINILSDELHTQRNQLIELKSLNNELKRTLHIQTQNKENQTIKQSFSTDNVPLEASKPQNSGISIGNDGVPTDRQTDRQTDRHPPISTESEKNSVFKPKNEHSYVKKTPILNKKINKIDHLEKVSEVLDSLDDIKKDIRYKFKRLTPQEMQVFSSIYQFENKNITVDYSLIAQKLSISESSIRDHVNNIIKKGIPIDKIKENNKKITLKISENLKKIANLHTIQALREL